VTITFCGPDTEGGACESANEVKVFLNEGHGETSGSGTVGNGQNAPVLDFTVDGGSLDTRVDTGGGFANITSANADDKLFPAKDFNGIDITIPGFTFTDIAFDVQLNPTEASGTDSFTAQAFSGAHISDGTATGSDTPDDDKQFSLTAVGGAFDEVNLLSADGFNEIKHIEISGLARVVGSAVPEPSTWAMLVAGFGLMGLVGYRKTRSGNALA
jgi:PEP-CTERM motif